MRKAEISEKREISATVTKGADFTREGSFTRRGQCHQLLRQKGGDDDFCHKLDQIVQIGAKIYKYYKHILFYIVKSN